MHYIVSDDGGHRGSWEASAFATVCLYSLSPAYIRLYSILFHSLFIASSNIVS